MMLGIEEKMKETENREMTLNADKEKVKSDLEVWCVWNVSNYAYNYFMFEMQLCDNRDLKQTRTATAVNKQLTFFNYR